MSDYARPDYDELQARIAADLATMPAVLCDALAACWARACHGLHGHLDWIDSQNSPLTCTLERLQDWANLYRVDRLGATAASGQVLATGVAGTTILADTLIRGQNDQDYRVSAAIALGAAATSIPVIATTTGSISNMAAGLTLTLVDPIPGAASSLTVDANGLSGGAAAESVESWRTRVAGVWQTITTQGARGGKAADYRYWAQSAHPSVSTALVQTHTIGLGTVIVRPICNSLADRLPTAAIIAAVEATLAAIAPTPAPWRVLAPIVHPVAVDISLNASVDTQANRDAIDANITALFNTETGENALLQTAELDATIATVTTQYTLNAPSADIAAAAGEIFTFSGASWS